MWIWLTPLLFPPVLGETSNRYKLWREYHNRVVADGWFLHIDAPLPILLLWVRGVGGGGRVRVYGLLSYHRLPVRTTYPSFTTSVAAVIATGERTPCRSSQHYLVLYAGHLRLYVPPPESSSSTYTIQKRIPCNEKDIVINNHQLSIVNRHWNRSINPPPPVFISSCPSNSYSFFDLCVCGEGG